MTSRTCVSVELSLTPREAFDALVDELTLALEKRGMKFDARPGGTVMEGSTDVGTIEEWVPGERISFLWRPKSWGEEGPTKLVVTFVPEGQGTEVRVESQDWGRVIGDEKEELLGWFAGELVAPFLWASAPERLGNWITDRHARSPSGPHSRSFYRDPVYHRPNFLAILDELSLGPEDYLLDVGCGGGAFLHEALKSGCRGAGIDHSADMVRVAKEANAETVTSGRLEVKKAEADSLPYPDGNFSCAVMTAVVFFLPDPAAAFREVFRVLRRGGRFVLFTGTKELRGTPAAPEPIASRLRFFEDGELKELASHAGFAMVSVEHPLLLEYAKKAGVPESDLPLFAGTSGSQLLTCRKI